MKTILTLLIALLLAPLAALHAQSDVEPGAKRPTTNARQWQLLELPFTAEKDCADPFDFTRAKFSAEFRGPSGERLEVPGFWDGERAWKIRFTPTRTGEWSYVTRFSDATDRGLHGQHGVFRAEPPGNDNALRRHGGFLKVSANHRYLTYTDDTPFFWLGDTWWAAPSANVPFDVFRRQVDARVAQGYTVYQAHGHRPLFADSQIGAFEAVRKPDAETLRYWRETDRYVAYADRKGLVGMMGFGRGDMFDPLSLNELQRLWHYYIARYGAYAISFLITQEYNIWPDKRQQHLPKMLAVGQFIKETDPYRRAMTAHPWASYKDLRQAWGEPWLDFIMLQAAHRRFESAEFYWGVFGRDVHKPMIEGEANYEGFANKDFNVNAAAIRRSAYTALQAGCFGFTYGAQGLYAGVLDRSQPGPTARHGPVLTWEEGLRLPGGVQLQHLRACYESVAWWKLEPSLGAVEPAGDVLVKADGTNVLLLYFLDGGNVSPNAYLSRMPEGGRYSAEWFDPRTGNRTKLESALVVQRERLRLLLPRRPDAQDWMLILKRTSEKKNQDKL